MEKDIDCVMLLSGGIDSKILLHYLIKVEGKTPYCLIFKFQENEEHLKAVKHALSVLVPFEVIEVKKMDSTKEYHLRNLIFLSHAIVRAINKLGVGEVYYATHYPPRYDKGYYFYDCSPEFIESLNKLLKPRGVKVLAPFLTYDLEQVLEIGKKLEVDLSDCQICNKEKGNCGLCPKCAYVIEELKKVNYPNPPKFNTTIYKEKKVPESMLYMHEWRIYHNNSCQLNCPFCSYGWSKDYEGKVLDIPEWLKVIDKAKECEVESLMFSGKEPLYDDKIFPILDYAKKKGFKTHINTNGVNLWKYKEMLKTITPDRILVSVNPSLPHIKKKVKAMKELLNYTLIQPYIVYLPEYDSWYWDKIDELVSIGIEKIYFRFVFPNSMSHKEQEAVLKKLQTKYPNLKIETPIDYGKGLEKWKHYKKYLEGRSIIEGNITYTFVHDFCQAYWRYLTILPNGDIVGCAKHTYLPYSKMKKYIIGNVLKLSSEEIVKRCKERLNKYKPCLPRW